MALPTPNAISVADAEPPFAMSRSRIDSKYVGSSFGIVLLAGVAGCVGCFLVK
jgi:hypothetical protein